MDFDSHQLVVLGFLFSRVRPNFRAQSQLFGQIRPKSLHYWTWKFVQIPDFSSSQFSADFRFQFLENIQTFYISYCFKWTVSSCFRRSIFLWKVSPQSVQANGFTPEMVQEHYIQKKLRRNISPKGYLDVFAYAWLDLKTARKIFRISCKNEVFPLKNTVITKKIKRNFLLKIRCKYAITLKKFRNISPRRMKSKIGSPIFMWKFWLVKKTMGKRLKYSASPLWIFHFPKIRPQIGFCPKIGCQQIGWCTVLSINEKSTSNFPLFGCLNFLFSYFDEYISKNNLLLNSRKELTYLLSNEK